MRSQRLAWNTHYNKTNCYKEGWNKLLGEHWRDMPRLFPLRPLQVPPPVLWSIPWVTISLILPFFLPQEAEKVSLDQMFTASRLPSQKTVFNPKTVTSQARILAAPVLCREWASSGPHTGSHGGAPLAFAPGSLELLLVLYTFNRNHEITPQMPYFIKWGPVPITCTG